MEERIQFIKSLIRPFMIVWAAIIYGVCILRGVEVPVPLTLLISAIVAEYFGERAVIRLKEKK